MSYVPSIAVAVLLPARLTRAVRTAVVPPGSLRALGAPEDLASHVHRHWCDVAVVDPELLIVARRLGEAVPPVTALVAFARLTPEAIRNTLDLVRARPLATRVLFQCQSRGREWLQHELADAVKGGDSEAFGGRIAGILAHAPSRVVDGIRMFCEQAHPSDTLRTLAACCATSRGSLVRWLARDGIPQPRRLVVAAQIVRAFRLLACEDIAVERVAEMLGLASAHTLEQRLNYTCGWQRQHFIGQHDSQQLISRIIARLTETASI